MRRRGGTCKTKRELGEYTVRELRAMAARSGVDLPPARARVLKSDLVDIIRSSCSSSHAKKPRTVSVGARVQGQRCSDRFTRAGQPYAKACSMASVEEKREEDAAMGLCEPHSLSGPETTSIALSGRGIAVGQGVNYATGRPVAAQVVMQQGGPLGMEINILTPQAQARAGIAPPGAARFTFHPECLDTSKYGNMGAVLAADSWKSLLVQMCDSPSGSCDKSVLFIEKLHNAQEQEAWKMKIAQYAELAASYPTYTLPIISAWVCGSGPFVINGGAAGGGLVGFCLARIPEGRVFKPLRNFMLDNTDPANWKNVLRTACNWAWRKIDPFPLMQKRFAQSFVRELMDMLWADGRVPNTVSPETFGVLVDTQMRPGGRFSPVILPCMDGLVQLEDRATMKSFIDLNTIIVYNSVALGVMRSPEAVGMQTPAIYQPPASLMGLSISVGSGLDLVLRGVMGYVITPTAQVVNAATRAPLANGISIRSAAASLYNLAGDVYTSAGAAARKIIDSLALHPWITTATGGLMSCAFLNVLVRYPHLIDAVLALTSAVALNSGYTMDRRTPWILKYTWIKLLMTAPYEGASSLIMDERVKEWEATNMEAWTEACRTANAADAESDRLYNELEEWAKSIGMDRETLSNIFMTYREPKNWRKDLVPQSELGRLTSKNLQAIERVAQKTRRGFELQDKCSSFEYERMRLRENIGEGGYKVYEGPMTRVQYEMARAKDEANTIKWQEGMRNFIELVRNFLRENRGVIFGSAVLICSAMVAIRATGDYRTSEQMRAELARSLDQRVALVNNSSSQ